MNSLLIPSCYLKIGLNIGEKDKAGAVVKTLPDISSSRELMMISSCDGKARAAACAEALLRGADKGVYWTEYDIGDHVHDLRH